VASNRGSAHAQVGASGSGRDAPSSASSWRWPSSCLWRARGGRRRARARPPNARQGRRAGKRSR
jgi:hypothetical protein